MKPLAAFFLSIVAVASVGCDQAANEQGPEARLDEILAWYSKLEGRPQNLKMHARIAAFEADERTRAAFLERLRHMKRADGESIALAGMARFMHHGDIDQILENRLVPAEDPLRAQILHSLVCRRAFLNAETLLSVLDRTKDDVVKHAAVNAMCDDRSRLCEGALNHPDPNVRHNALWGAPQTLEWRLRVKDWLRQALQETDPESFASYSDLPEDIEGALLYLHDTYDIKQWHYLLRGRLDNYAKRMLHITDEIDSTRLRMLKLAKEGKLEIGTSKKAQHQQPVP